MGQISHNELQNRFIILIYKENLSSRTLYFNPMPIENGVTYLQFINITRNNSVNINIKPNFVYSKIWTYQILYNCIPIYGKMEEMHLVCMHYLKNCQYLTAEFWIWKMLIYQLHSEYNCSRNNIIECIRKMGENLIFIVCNSAYGNFWGDNAWLFIWIRIVHLN